MSIHVKVLIAIGCTVFGMMCIFYTLWTLDPEVFAPAPSVYHNDVGPDVVCLANHGCYMTDEGECIGRNCVSVKP